MTQQRRRVLGERYEIDGLLGQGGMAKVFKGTDRVLGRTVAVKVLSPQFADDNSFVARFRREAQSAASLNHPNIVGVFDTGSHEDIHFIVMEYVQGKTLRDVLRAEGPLLPERAIEIADSVALALGSAHQAGMVHRDIKPGNIMITPEGQVKVMDFGIARTTTGDTLTQTAAVLGTASYLSPEQAQGEPVDPRSDIYSVGCVIYEMLTGRPPFTGDSPVAIAYKHVRDDPVPPTRLNPDIPQALETVVMKALAKNPANRYQSAEELREDLDRLQQGLPTLATPLLPGDPTEMVTRHADHTAVMTGTEALPEEERRRNPWLVALAVLLILGLLGLGAYFLVRSLLGPEVQQVEVPGVVGLGRRVAEERIRAAGLEPVVVMEESDEPRGRVLEQDPAEGALVDEGSEVTLTVSSGPNLVTVPGVIGLSEEDARGALEAEGLDVDVTTAASPEADGTVVDQDPAEGEEVPEGSTVTIVVSTGPEVVTVPDVTCTEVPQARQEIIAAGLEPVDGQSSEFSDECPEGTVARTDPPAGTEVEAGQTVAYFRSRGPEPTPSPTPTESPTP